MSNLIPENVNPANVVLFPGDDVPADPQDEFDALERGVDDFPEDSDLIVTSEERAPIGRSWKFNFGQTNGFLIGRSRGPVPTVGDETLKGWIDKVLHTARGAHFIHPAEYGVDDPFSMIGKPFNSHEQATYEDRVTDAVLFHPRITAVRDFEATYDPDAEAVYVAMTVVLDDESAVPITVAVNG